MTAQRSDHEWKIRISLVKLMCTTMCSASVSCSRRVIESVRSTVGQPSTNCCIILRLEHKHMRENHIHRHRADCNMCR